MKSIKKSQISFVNILTGIRIPSIIIRVGWRLFFLSTSRSTCKPHMQWCGSFEKCGHKALVVLRPLVPNDADLRWWNIPLWKHHQEIAKQTLRFDVNAMSETYLDRQHGCWQINRGWVAGKLPNRKLPMWRWKWANPPAALGPLIMNSVSSVPCL